MTILVASNNPDLQSLVADVWDNLRPRIQLIQIQDITLIPILELADLEVLAIDHQFEGYTGAAVLEQLQSITSLEECQIIGLGPNKDDQTYLDLGQKHSHLDFHSFCINFLPQFVFEQSEVKVD